MSKSLIKNLKNYIVILCSAIIITNQTKNTFPESIPPNSDWKTKGNDTITLSEQNKVIFDFKKRKDTGNDNNLVWYFKFLLILYSKVIYYLGVYSLK